MSSEDETDNTPRLSAATAAALQEFLAREQEAAQDSGDPFAENWNLSQFWYTDDTASTVAAEVVQLADGGQIACIACPSLFRRLRAEFPDAKAHLLEYDPRFEVLGNFSLYDYNEPLNVPEALHGAFEVVVADPPYLATECLEKTAETMRLLSRHPADAAKFLLLTGAIMQDAAKQLLGLRPAGFRPQHTNKLGNEFLLFSTVKPSNRLQGWDDDLDPGP